MRQGPQAVVLNEGPRRKETPLCTSGFKLSGRVQTCARWSREERDLPIGGAGAHWSEVEVVWGPLNLRLVD